MTVFVETLDINGRWVQTQATVSNVPARGDRNTSWVTARQHAVKNDPVRVMATSPGTTTDPWRTIERSVDPADYIHWARGTFFTVENSLNSHYLKHYRCRNRLIRFASIREYIRASHNFWRVVPRVSEPTAPPHGWTRDSRQQVVDGPMWTPIAGLDRYRWRENVGGRGGLVIETSNQVQHLPWSGRLLSFWHD